MSFIDDIKAEEFNRVEEEKYQARLSEGAKKIEETAIGVAISVLKEKLERRVNEIANKQTKDRRIKGWVLIGSEGYRDIGKPSEFHSKWRWAGNVIKTNDVDTEYMKNVLEMRISELGVKLNSVKAEARPRREVKRSAWSGQYKRSMFGKKIGDWEWAIYIDVTIP